jgi:acetoin utilization protein AcuB
MIVRQWMSTNYALLPIETSLPDALRFLNSRGVNLVGVLRHGHMAGAVTRAEIYEMLESGDPMTLLSRKTLASVVPPSVSIVFVDDPLDRAARLIVERGLPAIPVMDRDEMVGILTPTDVCRAVSETIGSRGVDAPVVMTMTVSRKADLLEEIERRSLGHSIVSAVAYPTSSQEMHVMLRMKTDAPVAIEKVA